MCYVKISSFWTLLEKLCKGCAMSLQINWLTLMHDEKEWEKWIGTEKIEIKFEFSEWIYLHIHKYERIRIWIWWNGWMGMEIRMGMWMEMATYTILGYAKRLQISVHHYCPQHWKYSHSMDTWYRILGRIAPMAKAKGETVRKRKEEMRRERNKNGKLLYIILCTLSQFSQNPNEMEGKGVIHMNRIYL